jgi:CubicO group peptidase (beta-lactamase class C family)
MIDTELATSIVVGLYDAGKLEIYGFGKGPDGKRPDGHTIYELGAVTKIYTALLFADAVQRREVSLDQPVAELLPPGVTMPVRDNGVITLRHLVNHSSGLPPLPPSVIASNNTTDPLRAYDENRLYADLVQTQLIAAPGERITVSEYGSGLLGHVLGTKIGTGYPGAVIERIVQPLGLTDTFFAVPPEAAPRRAVGTNQELQVVKPWSWGALAGAGALLSSVRDQLKVVDAELDAAAGSKQPLRAPMRLTQEAQLEGTGANFGLGWQIDQDGRYWHTGTTNGFHAFVGFDPKERRGLVILASTATPVIDQVSLRLYKVLAGETVPAPTVPSEKQLAAYAGFYDFSGAKLQVLREGKRLFVIGPGEPRIRMLPISDTEFWIESLRAIVVFQTGKDGSIARAVFIVGDQQMPAPRLEPAPTPAAP